MRLVRNLRARRLQRHQPSWCGAGGAAAAAANEPGTARGKQRAGQGRGPSDRAEGDDDAEEAEPGEGWGPGRVRVGGGWGGVLVSWSRPKGRAAGTPWSRPGAPVRTREASSRRRRSSTTSCCPTPSGWTPSPTCSWPRSKATWAGQCSSKSCGPGASSGPGNSPRKCAGACRMGRRQRLGCEGVRGRWGGGGSLSAPDRWTLNSAPVRADRFCAVIPGSRPKPGKHSSFLSATFLRDLPGSHQPSVSFAAASLQGFGLLSSDIRGPGEREGTGPAGKERSGPPGVLLGPLPVAGGSREDSSLSEQLDFSWC